MTIEGALYRERATAAQALIGWAQTAPLGQSRPVGHLGGFDISGVVKIDEQHGGGALCLALEGVPVEPAYATSTPRQHTAR
jgi:hypothetical protein